MRRCHVFSSLHHFIRLGGAVHRPAVELQFCCPSFVLLYQGEMRSLRATESDIVASALTSIQASTRAKAASAS